MRPTTKYYWDSSVFISHITGESTRSADELDGISEIVREIEGGRALLMTAVVTDTEVLTDGLSAEKRLVYEGIFKTSRCVKISIDHVVSERARQFREAFRQAGRALTTPDAQHLAAAVVYDASEFHTFDERLIAVSGNSLVAGLVIRKPRGSQRLLPL